MEDVFYNAFFECFILLGNNFESICLSSSVNKETGKIQNT